MQNEELRDKQIQLERRNQQLQYRKRQIERQLQNLDADIYDQQQQEISEKQQTNLDNEEDINQDRNQNQNENQAQTDIINQLESIKKANLEKNHSKFTQLKKQFQTNKVKVQKNKQRLQKLQNNIQLAKSAVGMKNQLKQQIQSKGKKLSQQSKKWISEVGKLNDKNQNLRTTLATLQKQEQSLKSVYQNSQRKLSEIQRDKISYDNQNKTIHSKVDAIKGQIQKAKQLFKQKQIVSKQETQKSQKQKQKAALNQKRLQRQKNQLIKAYKKLSQYIALLRKCNTHLQTANSLGFNLKEYLQSIDKTDMIV